MAGPKLAVPNLDRIQIETPKLGEAVQAIQKYVNLATTAPTGNRLAPPPKGLVNPSGV